MDREALLFTLWQFQGGQIPSAQLSHLASSIQALSGAEAQPVRLVCH